MPLTCAIISMNKFDPFREYALITLATLMLTLPFFLSAYRISVANLVPIDDYRTLLLSLANHSLDHFNAPFGYRMLTLMLAVPLTRFSPPHFTRTDAALPEEWIQATFALCVISYLFFVGTTLILYACAKGCGVKLCGRAFALTLLWCAPSRENYLYPLTDASALFFIALLWWGYERKHPFLFAGFSLLGIAAKESVVLVIGLLLICHLLCWRERRRYALQSLFLLIPSLLLYGWATWYLHFPGNEGQWQFGEYAGRFLKVPALFLTTRGVLLNLFPCWPIGFACVIYVWLTRRQVHFSHTHWSNFGVPLCLCLLGIALDVKYNLGRIVVLSLPLFIEVIGKAGARMVTRHDDCASLLPR